MGKLDVGNILYHKDSDTHVKVIETDLMGNTIRMKVLDGDHEGVILNRALSRINERVVNDEMVAYKVNKTKQNFSMTPVKFIPEIEVERIEYLRENDNINIQLYRKGR